MRNINYCIILMVFTVCLTSFHNCSCIDRIIQKRKAVQNCRFRIEKIEQVKWDPLDPEGKIQIDIRLEIKNPRNNIDVVLDKLDAILYINNNEVVKVSNTKDIKVKKGEKKSFLVSALLHIGTINKTLLESMNSGKAFYKIKGKVYFNTIIGERSFSITILEAEETAPE